MAVVSLPPLVVRTGNILLASGRVVIVVEVPVSRKLVLDDAGKAWVKVAAGRVAQAPDEACGHFQSFQSDGKASDKAGRESPLETKGASCDGAPEGDERQEEKNFSSFDPESFEGREAREVYRLIANDKFVTTLELAARMGISKRTVIKRVALLKELGAIVRYGSSRAGHWVCVPEKACQEGICAPEAAKAVDDGSKSR